MMHRALLLALTVAASALAGCAQEEAVEPCPHVPNAPGFNDSANGSANATGGTNGTANGTTNGTDGTGAPSNQPATNGTQAEHEACPNGDQGAYRYLPFEDLRR